MTFGSGLFILARPKAENIFISIFQFFHQCQFLWKILFVDFWRPKEMA